MRRLQFLCSTGTRRVRVEQRLADIAMVSGAMARLRAGISLFFRLIEVRPLPITASRPCWGGNLAGLEFGVHLRLEAAFMSSISPFGDQTRP